MSAVGPRSARTSRETLVLTGTLERLCELAGPRPRVLVAFSGGVDSTVLAHTLVEARRRLGGLRLLHVDHGLQAASRAWAAHCAAQARRWRVPLAIRRVDAGKTRGQSPEAAARAARQRAFITELRAGEVLVTAQHRDDQAETLLLQLLRGAGVAGLAAMPAVAVLGAGRIVRPLLGVTRARIEQVARAAALSWIDDPTNTDTRFSRNFVRHRLMPLIREHWSGADRALARTAEHMAEAATLLAERAATDLAAMADGEALSVAALRRLPVVRRRNALRAFIARAGIERPEAARLREMAGPLLDARADAQPEVRWADAVMQRRRGRLELHVKSEDLSASRDEMPAKSWRWKRDREFSLGGGLGTIALLDDVSGPVDLAKLPSRLEVRLRSGGERLRPGPGARTQALKKLLQTARLSVEERARVPLLFAGKSSRARLVAAGDRWLDASVMANVKSRRRARFVVSPPKGDRSI